MNAGVGSIYTCPHCGQKSVGTTAAEEHVEEFHPEKITVTPNGCRVRYLGYYEVPESEQVWEIHLRPKRSPES